MYHKRNPSVVNVLNSISWLSRAYKVNVLYYLWEFVETQWTTFNLLISKSDPMLRKPWVCF